MTLELIGMVKKTIFIIYNFQFKIYTIIKLIIFSLKFIIFNYRNFTDIKQYVFRHLDLNKYIFGYLKQYILGIQIT